MIAREIGGIAKMDAGQSEKKLTPEDIENSDMKTAFEKAVEKYQGRLLRYCKKITNFDQRDSGTPQDLAQDTLYKAFRSLQTFKGNLNDAGSDFFIWLCAIARNKSCDDYRKTKNANIVPLEDLPPEVISEKTGYDHSEQKAINKIYSEELISELSPQDRRLLELSYVDGLGSKQIAEILGVPVNTVRVNIYRLRHSLIKKDARLHKKNIK